MTLFTWPIDDWCLLMSTLQTKVLVQDQLHLTNLGNQVRAYLWHSL